MPATPTKPSSGSLTGIGPWWRKLRERQSQAMAEFFPSFVDTSFTTPKTRQAFMEEEARQFALNIKAMEKDIRGLKLADETFMNTCQEVLASDLPRVYDFGPDGHVHAVGELNTIGRGCNAEDLVRVQQELSQGLEQDVLTPMKQWLFAWSTVQARLKELEEMRIEVDSRKRQVFNLRQKETKMKENLDSSMNDHQRKVREKKLEETWRMQQRKDAKLANATATYQSMESEVLEELAGLIRDAVCLKSYLAACTEFQREAYQSLTHALLGTHGMSQGNERVQADLRVAKGNGTSSPSGAGKNPFNKEVNLQLSVTPDSSPVKKGSGKANPKTSSGHALYGDDIKISL